MRTARFRPQYFIAVGLLSSLAALVAGVSAYHGMAVPRLDSVGPLVTLGLSLFGATVALIAATRSPDLSFAWMSVLMTTLVLAVFGTLLTLVLLVAQVG